MKYVIFLILSMSSTFAMQQDGLFKMKTNEKSQQEIKIEMLKKLGNERSNLSLKDFQEALRVLNELALQNHDKILATKALWGIARACHDSYAPDSLALAEVLIQAGADPNIKIKVEDILSLVSKDGKGFSGTSMDYETTVMETCSGSLKKYLETKPKN